MTKQRSWGQGKRIEQAIVQKLSLVIRDADRQLAEIAKRMRRDVFATLQSSANSLIVVGCTRHVYEETRAAILRSIEGKNEATLESIQEYARRQVRDTVARGMIRSSGVIDSALYAERARAWGKIDETIGEFLPRR